MGIIRGLMELASLDKAARFGRIVKQNGGIRETLALLFRTDDMKEGTLMGEDEFGNRYYQNPFYQYPRDRWCITNKRVHLDYDGSQIPAEWNRWLQHTTDVVPTPEVQAQRKKSWQLPHEENLSGTTRQYVPYSTVRPKIEAWNPRQPSA